MDYDVIYRNSSVDSGHNVLNVFYWEKILVSAILGLISIAGIVGNCMIIAAVAFSRKLQTPTNVFVISLSVVDLLTSFSLIWYGVSLLGKDGWPIPGAYWICEFTGFVILSCLGTTVLNLAAISVNRLVLITKPSLFKKIFTSWKLFVLVTIPWIVPSVTIVALLATGNGAFGYDETDQACLAVDTHEKTRILINVYLAVVFPLPFVIILASYLSIYVFLKKHFRERMRNCSRQKKKTIIDRRQIQITKNLFVVVCALIVCYGVIVVITTIERYSGMNSRIEFYFYIPIFGNCAVNFFIYARKHSIFRVVIGHMINRSYADIPQPSYFLKFLLNNDNPTVSL